MPTKANPELSSIVHAKITFDYNKIFILPYEDGVAVMNYFRNAEQMEEGYQKDAKIYTMKEGPKLEIMSHEQYSELRMVAVLQPEEKEDE